MNDDKAYISTTGLHTFFKRGTCGTREAGERNWLYLSHPGQSTHSFSDYPDTHYLSGPESWQDVREKIIKAKSLGVEGYQGILNDLGILLDDILILSLHSERSYWVEKQIGCRTSTPSEKTFWDQVYKSNITYSKDTPIN